MPHVGAILRGGTVISARKRSTHLFRVAGRTTLAWALNTLCGLDDVTRVVIVVAPPLSIEEVSTEVANLCLKPLQMLSAAAPEKDSIRAAMEALSDCSHVLIHEMDRPFASADLALRVLRAAYEHGAALPAVPSQDPLWQVEAGRLAQDFSDKGVVLSQSPQAFSYPLLWQAHVDNVGAQAEDEAQLVAALGHKVVAVEGERWNVKVSSADDVEPLEALLREAGRL